MILVIFAQLLSCAAYGYGGTHTFHYASDIGMAADHSGVVCLAINNSELAGGRQIALVILSTPQSIAQAEVLRAAPDACQNAEMNNAGFSYYELRVLKGALTPMAPAVAVVDPARPLKVAGNSVSGDLEGDGRQEYFRQCTSSEGVHLTVWTGRPLRGRRRWHGYYYLGYDVEPNCTTDDTAKPRSSGRWKD